MFPLIPVPGWLVQLLPSIFSPSASQVIAILGLVLGLVGGIGRLIMPIIDGEKSDVNKQFIILGFGTFACGLLIFLSGGYGLILLTFLALILGIWWLIRRIRKIVS